MLLALEVPAKAGLGAGNAHSLHEGFRYAGLMALSMMISAAIICRTHLSLTLALLLQAELGLNAMS